jgi:ferredoxin-NADP reductase
VPARTALLQTAGAHTTAPAHGEGAAVDPPTSPPDHDVDADASRAAHATSRTTVDWSTEPGAVLTTVTSIEQVTPTVKLFTLRVDTSLYPEFTFKAGQWLDIFMPDQPVIGGFSLANSPAHAAAAAAAHGGGAGAGAGAAATTTATAAANSTLLDLQVAIKFAEWAPTLWMHEVCKEGSQVRIRAGGTVCIDQVAAEDSYLFIGGGIGVSPLHGMVQQILSQPTAHGHVSMLYSANASSELLFSESLNGMFASHHRFQNLRYFITANTDEEEHEEKDKDEKAMADGTATAAGAATGGAEVGPKFWRLQQIKRRIILSDLAMVRFAVLSFSVSILGVGTVRGGLAPVHPICAAPP